MKKSIIYLRVSREKDGEKDLSIESQLEQCRKKAADLKASVVKVFTDRDKSGRSNKRPEFQQALEFCQVADIDFFIVWSTSRFSRNIVEAKADKIRLERSGTKVKYVTTEIEDSDAGFLHLSILELFDDFTSRQIAADTRRSMSKNAADGYWNGGRLPYGFQVVQDIHDHKRKRLIPNEDEAVIVRKIFAYRTTGLGAKGIAEKLNMQAVMYRGDNWNKTRVTSILRNKKVIGISVFGKVNHDKVKQPPEKWVEVHSHDPLIDIELWNKVQTMMNEATYPAENGAHNSSKLFTGLLRCGHCDMNLKVLSGRGRSKRYYYYVCPNHKVNPECTTQSLPAKKIDDWLIDVLCHQILSPDRLDAITYEFNKTALSWETEKEKMGGKYRQDLKKIRDKKERLIDLLEDPESGVDLSDIGPRIKTYTGKIKEINQRLEDLVNVYSPGIIDLTPDVLSEFFIDKLKNDADLSSKRSFIKTFVTSMVVTNGCIDIQYAPGAIMKNSPVMVPGKKRWLPDRLLPGTISLTVKLPVNIPAVAA